ncbi:MAG: hypothetical protein WCX83_02925 [Candidatus Cloacimonas sp.]|jgi:hypothetical protein
MILTNNREKSNVYHRSISKQARSGVQYLINLSSLKEDTIEGEIQLIWKQVSIVISLGTRIFLYQWMDSNSRSGVFWTLLVGDSYECQPVFL